MNEWEIGGEVPLKDVELELSARTTGRSVVYYAPVPAIQQESGQTDRMVGTFLPRPDPVVERVNLRSLCFSSDAVFVARPGQQLFANLCLQAYLTVTRLVHSRARACKTVLSPSAPRYRHRVFAFSSTSLTRPTCGIDAAIDTFDLASPTPNTGD